MKLAYLRSINGFSFTELMLVLVIIGAMASLSLVVFSDQLAKSRHKKNVANDTSWLLSIQNKAVEQNKVCVIRIDKATSKAFVDNSSFSAIDADEYCNNINSYEFNAAIDSFAPPYDCSSDANNLYIIFPPSGVVPCGGEILLKSDSLKQGSSNGKSEIRCINILSPMGQIRQGLQTQAIQESGGTCDYTNAF